MSYGSPDNPYGQPQNPPPPGPGAPQDQPPYGAPQGQPGQPGQPGYGYPQYPQQGQAGYGYPQAPGVPPQQGYGYPQQGGYPGGPRVASMARRFSARLIDGAAFLIIYLVLIFAGVAGSIGSMQDCDPNSVNYDSCMNDAGSDFAGSFGVVFIVFMLIAVLYEWLMIGLVGATLGKLCVGIRVVKADTGQKPGLGSAFIRYIIAVVGSFACGIGQLLVYLSPFWDKSGRQQGWHDKAASTMVIQN
ncbi:RDD family protein [Streptomyces sp. NPDC023723]|uniref:RDD family protein n=1 Tax=Streptomyces sp. NPDC023723 TaxID=3154323 RepID=UPI0033F18E64